MIQDLGVILESFHQHIRLVGPQKGLDPADGIGSVDDYTHQFGAVEIAQDAMDEVFVAVEQHRRTGRLGRLLDCFPLAQQRFEIVDQQLLGHRFGLGADQQACAGGLDQHAEGPQAIALVLAINAAGNVDALAVGLEDQEAPWQAEIAGETRPLAAGGFLHHLHQHLLARLEQFGDAGAALLQAQGAEIGDVDEAVLFALTDVDEGGVDAGQHVFNGAEVNVADLVAALGHHQLVDTFVGEHCGDSQLLGDDDLLGHGGSGSARGSPALGGRSGGGRRNGQRSGERGTRLDRGQKSAGGLESGSGDGPAEGDGSDKE